MTPISYTLAKALKEFCPDLPEPMGGKYYCKECGEIHREMAYCTYFYSKSFPAYQLHDILSKEFCEKIAEKHPHIEYFKSTEMDKDLPWEIFTLLCEEYCNGGLPAVEKAMFDMMEGK